MSVNTSKYNTTLGEDLSKPQENATKFVRKPLEAGSALIRLIQVIDYGVQPQDPYEGEEKPDVATRQLTFEVVSKKHREEYEVEGEKKIGARYLNISYGGMKISNHPKSNHSKTFTTMNYKGTATKFYELLGEVYKCELVPSKSGKMVYIKDIKPPLYEETIDGEGTGKMLPLKAHSQINDSKVFLWDQPFIEDWNALEIEGNNFIQEKILAAKNYVGSPLQALLSGINLDDESNSEDQLDGIV